MLKALLILTFMIFQFTNAKAEYRVFKLKIINTKNKTSRTVHSTLDWVQYHDYNYLQPSEVVRLEDTWMCWKRHHRFKPLCKRPVTSATLKAENEDAGG